MVKNVYKLMLLSSLFAQAGGSPFTRPEQHVPDREAAVWHAQDGDVRADILREARRHVGVAESGGDNRGVSKFTGTRQPVAWCAAFASYVIEQAAPGSVTHTLLAKDLQRQARRSGAYHAAGTYTPQPGDLIFFERGDDGDWRGHVGFVESVDADGTIHTIEGNKAHPDFQGQPGYRYDPARPDAVRRVTYRPDEFSHARVLGFGDIEILTGQKPRPAQNVSFWPDIVPVVPGLAA